MYYICLYHTKNKSAMIELKSSFKNNSVVYTPKRKKCKKSALWAARLNGLGDNVAQQKPKQIKMFLLRKKKN
tara:strand:+ start:492 stop:707 length:216 start_codon:yes stop_codon:yes gene_type:complete